MKKKILILLISIILIIPIPTGVYKDGGTRTYTALTYKIVVWNRFISDNNDNGEDYTKYHKTSIFLFPNNFKSLDTLWKIEEAK